MLRKILYTLMGIKWKFLFLNLSLVLCKNGAKFIIGKNVKIFKCVFIINDEGLLEVGNESVLKGCKVHIDKSAILRIGNHCKIYNDFSVNGKCIIGDNNYLMHEASFILEGNSSLHMGNCNRIFCTFWLRFSGGARIGNYNTINQYTEIRCDDSVIIGDYNQVSMSNRIWDTNTHRIFRNIEDYKQHIISHFPNFNEDGKPKTRPVVIGSCNWFGENVFVKSSKIGNHNIVGFRTSVINKTIDNDNTITNYLECRIVKY